MPHDEPPLDPFPDVFSDALADPPLDPLEELKDRIETFLLGLQHPVLTEPGRDVMHLTNSNYSLSTEYHKLLWHVWDDRTNFVRQVTGIHKESAARMELRFQKFGKGPPGKLILAESRAAAEQLERRSDRYRYAQLLRRFLAQLFTHWKIEELSTEPDLKNSFSGCYTRGMLVLGQRAWAFIGAGEQEDAHSVDAILTYGLIWLDWLRGREHKRVLEGLKIFVPPKRADTTLQRLAWMNPKIAQWEVYETGTEILRRDPADVGNLKTTLAPAGGFFSLQSDEDPNQRDIQRFVKRIQALSPGIETRFGTDNFRVFSICGLPFAKQTATGITFGIGRAETLLSDENFGQLKRLASQILRFRRPQSSAGPGPEARLHAFYRFYPERWLQSILVRQIGILGYELVREALYEQVPAVSGMEGGFIDLLGITAAGRLVVVEIKASEDIHLPLQALDYWMRVHWHQRRGELERLGYFPQRVLSSSPPLLLLISPALQFHSGCETVLRYFSPEVETVLVGINENWREGLQVLFRRQV